VFKKHYHRNRVSLYSDYINRFGNIDVDNDLALNFDVVDHIKQWTTCIYDDDIKAKKRSMEYKSQ
jgi:hypothetical protein